MLEYSSCQKKNYWKDKLNKVNLGHEIIVSPNFLTINKLISLLRVLIPCPLDAQRYFFTNKTVGIIKCKRRRTHKTKILTSWVVMACSLRYDQPLADPSIFVWRASRGNYNPYLALWSLIVCPWILYCENCLLRSSMLFAPFYFSFDQGVLYSQN